MKPEYKQYLNLAESRKKENNLKNSKRKSRTLALLFN
jgi:hypothetical protein